MLDPSEASDADNAGGLAAHDDEGTDKAGGGGGGGEGGFVFHLVLLFWLTVFLSFGLANWAQCNRRGRVCEPLV